MRRARVTRRAALAALAGIPALAACTRIGAHAGSTGSPPAVGSMMPEVKDLTVDVARADPGGEGWRVDLSPEGVKSSQEAVLPSQAGPLVALVSGYYGESLENGLDAALMALDPADGSLAWARLVTLPGGVALRQDNYSGIPWGEIRAAAGRSAVAVSPDGRHVCVIVRAYVSSVLSEHVSAAAVLDAASGQVVRAEEIRGFVLGQALTDDALVIQTSSLLHPGSETVIAGPDGPDGPGADDVVDTTSTLTAFPLTDPQAPPTTGSTPLWLLGATRDSLILGAARIDPECLEGNCLGYRTALATASGQVTGQIDGVYAVHPNGFLERFTGGKADDDALTAVARDAPASTVNQGGESSWNRVWAALGRELLDPASGATADTTGFTLSHVPTASGWITTRWRPAWSESDRGPAFTPQTAGWMDAPGPVSTEPIMMLSRDGPHEGSSTFTASLTRTALTDRSA